MDLVNVVTNLGFPIAISAYLIINDMKMNKLLLERVEKLESYQKEVLADLVSNNTIVMTKMEQALSSRPCLKDSI